jgi:hypothetical protein
MEDQFSSVAALRERLPRSGDAGPLIKQPPGHIFAAFFVRRFVILAPRQLP